MRHNEFRPGTRVKTVDGDGVVVSIGGANLDWVIVLVDGQFLPGCYRIYSVMVDVTP